MYNRKNFGGEATYSAPSERDATNEGIESNERLKGERAKSREEREVKRIRQRMGREEARQLPLLAREEEGEAYQRKCFVSTDVLRISIDDLTYLLPR